jgi:hypothetical protein
MRQVLQLAEARPDNQVEITKKITTITLGQMYRSGPGWEYGGTRELRFVFSARGDTETALHTSLRVVSRTFWDDRDQFVLDDQQVKTLADSLQDKAVASGFQMAKKKQQTIDMFN